MSVAVRSENPAALAVTEPADGGAIARLAEWAQAAQAAFQVADKLATTQFVPQQYRNKPMEATAAILAGIEVGLSPMASLRAFDNIQGTPAPKAITLRAITLGMGHEVVIEESTDVRAVVAVRRKGSERWQRSTWDLDRARKMGLTGKDQWKNQPGAMLVARATSEGCRWVAADAIMGMAYSAEELRDHELPAEERSSTRRVSAADLLEVADSPAPLVEAVEPVSDPPAQPVEPMSPAQRARMFVMFAEKGIAGADVQREYVAKVLGRTVESRGGLSRDEAGKVIDALERLPMADLDTGGADLDDPTLPTGGEE